MAPKAPAGFDSATVAEAMHSRVITCPHGTSLRAVARMMDAYKMHCVAVFDERDESADDRLWGIVDPDSGLPAGVSSTLDLARVAAEWEERK